MPAHLLAARRTAVLDAIERYQITSISLTGSAANAIVDAAGRGDRKWRLESLRLVGMGAETVVPDVLRRLGRFLEASGAPSEVVQTGYGTTETGLLAGGTHPTAHPVGGVDAASLYGCAPGVELRIVDENDTVLAEGDLGEIQARCPHAIFSCYWNDAGATKASFAGDGWWRTGDLGRLQNGELSLHGRTKEILNISGRKFSLAAIDAEIASVVGVGDRTFSCAIHLPGEVAEGLAVAFVPANPSGEYAREVVEKIGRVVRRTYGISPSPVLVTTIDQIPLTANGKLRRSELSTRVQSGVLAPALRRDVDEAAVVRDQTRVGADLEARLADIWRDALNLQGALDRTADFFDLGGDSLRSLLLHTAIEQQFGKQISADAFFARPTFATLLELVAGDGPPLDKDPELPVPWPLPRDLRNRLLLSFEAWDGNRPTRDRLVAGLNTTGSNTPLFWVCQENVTFRQLADCLGATQPVYAFRSGLGLIEYSEDEIQAFALRYASEAGRSPSRWLALCWRMLPGRDHCIGARPTSDPARPSCSSPNSGGLGGAAASLPRAGVVHLRPRQLAGQSIPAIPQSGFGARAHVRRLHGGRSAGRPWRVLRDRIQANSASAHAEGGRPLAGSLAEIRTSRSFKCGRCSRPADLPGRGGQFRS